VSLNQPQHLLSGHLLQGPQSVQRLADGPCLRTVNQPRRGLLALLLTGQSMAIADTSIANVAAPSIREGLGATGPQLEFVISGCTLTLALLMITGARLGDIRGYRRAFLGGLAVFTLASLACGLSPNADVLIAGRMVQGAGAALLVPQVLTTIQLTFTGSERTRAIGLYAVALSGSAVIGQVLGGLVVAANLFGATWRPAFMINVPIGLALMVATPWIMRRDRDGRQQRLDTMGVAVLSLAVLLVMAPLIVGPENHWPVWTLLCLVASLPAFIGFVAVERRVAARDGYPLVNLSVLAQPTVAWGLAAFGIAGSTAFGMFLVIALYLQQGLGKTALYSGLVSAAWLGAFSIAGPLLRRMPAHRGGMLAPTGCASMAAAFAGLGISAAIGRLGAAPLVGLLAIAGFGFGLCRIALTDHLSSIVPTRYAADISGLINTDSYITATAGVALFGTVYLGLASTPGVLAATRGFAIVNAAFALAALFAAACAFGSFRERRLVSLSSTSEDSVTPARRVPRDGRTGVPHPGRR
jgi:MFS family permease